MKRRGAAARDAGSASELVTALWMVNHTIRRASNHDALTTGLSAADRVMLMLIDAYPGATVAELAGLLGDDRANIRRVTRRLDARALLARASDPADRRRARLTLTQQGRALLCFGAPGAVGRVGTRLVTTLPPDALHAVSHAVTTIYNELKK